MYDTFRFRPVCLLLFFLLFEQSLSLNLVWYKQAHNSQGLKYLRIFSNYSYIIFTRADLKYFWNYKCKSCYSTKSIIIIIWIVIKMFINLIDIVSESTFVSLRRIVGPVTFWECTVAFGRSMTLDNSSGNIEFCAISFKSQMTISSIKENHL